MQRLVLAFRSFFAILFRGELPADLLSALRQNGKVTKPAVRAEEPVQTSNGALQMLAILQRDARLVDFLMEDVSQYNDEQVGAAVRDLHLRCRKALSRYVSLEPIIDGVEGGFTPVEAGPGGRLDASRIKLLGNVPADGIPKGGLLRHKGWRAERVELPPVDPRHDLSVIAPAEIEIE
jgi:hypothetical protein